MEAGGRPGGKGGVSAPNRRFFDKLLRDPTASLRGDAEARKLLAAMREFHEPMDLLFRLTKPQEHGIKRVREMLSTSGSRAFMADVAVPFLELLGSDDLSRGTCRAPLEQLLGSILTVPGFLDCLHTAVKAGAVPDLSSVSWFLLRVASREASARSDTGVQAMAATLKERGAPGAHELEVVLKGAVAGAEGEPNDSIEDVRERGWGRHDNDNADYRSIRLVPTAGEVLAPRPPFLPQADARFLADTPEAALLDRQFRLLREDMVAPLRAELRALHAATEAAHARGAGGSLKLGAMRNVFFPVHVREVRARPRPCVAFSVQLPLGHRASRMKTYKERKAFWEESGRGTLPMDCLVCLVKDGKPMAFATVVRRETAELAAEMPTIGLAFIGADEEAGPLLAALAGVPTPEMVQEEEERRREEVQAQGGPQPRGPQRGRNKDRGKEKAVALHELPLLHQQLLPGVALVQVSASFFAYRPVLECLQGMQSVPLSEELVLGGGPRHADVVPSDVLAEEMARFREGLDASQRKALTQGLTQRVSLIQGPPGTGKTYVGVQLCDILARRTPEKILCVCYTNHALDQFLEALLDAGIDKVVRIGSRSKSERLQRYNLRELVNSGTSNAKMTASETSRMFSLRDRRNELQDKVEGLRERMARSVPRMSNEGHWPELNPFLKERYPNVWRQLQPPKRGAGGMQIASGRGSKAMRPADMWRNWRHGKPPMVERASSGRGGGGSGGRGRGRGGEHGAGTGADSSAGGDNISDIFAWSPDARRAAIQRWVGELREWHNEQLAGGGEHLWNTLMELETVLLELRALDAKAAERVLCDARVIGCTTTGAASNKDALAAAGVTVLVVEEAAEILEAHVLTSLSRGMRQVVLIGDHRQLRPKVETYELSVQAGRGHTLNVSLFERMVLGGYPHATLGVQHRMRPEISALVRPTYPDLRDHDSVLKHPSVRGLADNVVFIDHTELELSEAGAAQGWVQQHQSRVNEFEVGMTVSIVRYLKQQGYAPSNMVVLTPYLGQLVELQRALQQEGGAAINELDMRDLRNATLPQAMAGMGGATTSWDEDENAPSKAVRVATIDNYQGEEADVVIVSLVRSNTAGSVGFLREPERINVMLSRARHGLIMLGNSATLLGAKSPAAREHWGGVLGLLAKGGHVYSGLPAVCQCHGCRAAPDLATPADFEERTPSGGCRQPCGQPLPCGHPCPLMCHAFDRDHEHVYCKEVVHAYCGKGHLLYRECGSTRPQPCATCSAIARAEAKAKEEMRRVEKEQAKVRSKAEEKVAQAKAKNELLRQRLRAMEESAALRQAEVQAKAESRKLAEAVRLQEEALPAELAAREARVQRQADEEVQRMQEEAALEAQLRAEQRLREEEEGLQGRRSKKQRTKGAAVLEVSRKPGGKRGAEPPTPLAAPVQAEESPAQLQAKLDAAARELRVLQRETDRKLQGLENKKMRAGEAAAAEAASIQQDADNKRQHLRSVLGWKQAAEAAAGGGDGLLAFCRLLSEVPQAAAAAAADQLDVAFNQGGLGQQLLHHAALHAGFDAATAAAELVVPFERGLRPLQKKEWLAAHGVFSVMAGEGGDASARARPLEALCGLQLGEEPSRVLELLQVEEGIAPLHPLEHLALALAAGALVAGAPIKERRALASQACGQALAYLLHPASAELLPATCRELAQGVMSQHAPTMVALPAALPEEAARAEAATAASKEQQAWELRAQGSPALTALLQLTGLRAVKRDCFSLCDEVELNKERKRDLASRSYNVLFYGNPGTGKTTVARLYAQLLKEMGVLPGDEVAETSGADLVSGGQTKLDELLKKLDKGGVLFIDEAYQLKPALNPQGAQVLDKLLPEMENRRGKLAVVLAGYQKHMEGLLAYNEGLPSRFPQSFTFEDYSDEELHAIFQGLLEAGKPRFAVEATKYGRIAARRLGRMRGMPGFGNARAVRNLYEQAIKRQSTRVIAERAAGGQPDLLLLQRDDLLGPKHIDETSSAALRELAGMQGLEAVKQSVANLLGLIRTNAELEEAELPLKAVSLNRVFVGNPGTGKTTVAGIYGRVLRDLGLLSKGDVVVKTPADFLGSVLGESEKTTAAALDAALGCVLVIDEAYGLHAKSGSDPYREAVIDTIVAKVQGVPGDDRCVLLLGYEEQMGEMLRKANPGLARRFQLEDAWRFDDYSSEQLLRIMRSAARAKYGWALPLATACAAVGVLDKQRRKPNFGNAGAVNNLLSRAAQRMEERVKALPPTERARCMPEVEDFLPAGSSAKLSDPEAVFEDLIGCKSVLGTLREIQATIQLAQKRGQDPLKNVELTFLFVGNPGTGKTTVARRMGMLFESVGLLADGSNLVSCSASDFTTGYVGQAGNKTRELFERALGGVLFIDEAYRLNPKVGGLFMQEALDEIVQLLTEPRFQNKMVVILAGYEAEVDTMLATNPDLKSRMTQKLRFPDFEPTEACQLLRQLLQADGLRLDEQAEEQLPSLMTRLVGAPGWANGRDVATWAKRIYRQAAMRQSAAAAAANKVGAPSSNTAGGGGPSELVCMSDLQASLEDFLASKADVAPNANTAPPVVQLMPMAPPAFQTASASAPPPPVVRTAVAEPPVAVQQQQQLQEDDFVLVDEEEEHAPPTLQTGAGGGDEFDGLPDDFLRGLQDALGTGGYDTSSLDAMQVLASDVALADGVLDSLAGGQGGYQREVLREMVRQWQQALQQALERAREMEREARRRRQRPVWRCAVCGRYSCNFRPYIERYEEVPE